LAALDEFGRLQVTGALAPLSAAEQRIVREGLMLYARALKAMRSAQDELESVS
jgi:hypothetical protein